jgi:hypothetical protein
MSRCARPGILLGWLNFHRFTNVSLFAKQFSPKRIAVSLLEESNFLFSDTTERLRQLKFQQTCLALGESFCSSLSVPSKMYELFSSDRLLCRRVSVLRGRRKARRCVLLLSAERERDRQFGDAACATERTKRGSLFCAFISSRGCYSTQGHANATLTVDLWGFFSGIFSFLECSRNIYILLGQKFERVVFLSPF